MKPVALISLLALLFALLAAAPIVRATTGGAPPSERDPEMLVEPRLPIAASPPAAPPEPKLQGRAKPILGLRAAKLARRWVGTLYRWGGASPGGFDCSGLVYYTFKQLGVILPHNAAELYGHGRPVPRSGLEPGDLLFFEGLGHVGMYVGRGDMIHAPQSGGHVEVISLAGRYGERFIGARRITRAA